MGIDGVVSTVEGGSGQLNSIPASAAQLEHDLLLDQGTCPILQSVMTVLIQVPEIRNMEPYF